MNTQRILFIGGTGNISSECASLLHSKGHEVAVLTRGRRAVPAAYKKIVADRNDSSAVLDALGHWNPDVVIDFLGYEIADVECAFQMFSERAQHYVFISSATVYQKPPSKLPITEAEPLGNAWWDYARKKIACEQWLMDQHAKSGFPVTIVRPSHTYSKLWVPNAISSSSYTFAARLEQGKAVYIHDRGDTPWTLTASSDFAVGLAGLVLKPAAIGRAFHVTSDEVLTWNQIYGEIAGALGAPVPQVVPIPTEFLCTAMPKLTGSLKGDKAHPGVFDNGAIKALVPEFKCQKPFRLGVRESIEWLRAHPEDQNLNPELDAQIERLISAWIGRLPGLTTC